MIKKNIKKKDEKAMLKRLQQLNPNLDIKSINAPEFLKFGRILTEYDFSEAINLVKDFPVPDGTTTYIPELYETVDLTLYSELCNKLYGEMPIQIGFGGGYNSSLNALEWHKGNEVNVAVSDFVILISSTLDMADGKVDSSKVQSFYLEKGQAVELYATTLHYSPCNVCAEAFRMIVVLPRGTNLPLDKKPEKGSMLFGKNKWLLAHREAADEIAAGAYIGVVGENLSVII